MPTPVSAGLLGGALPLLVPFQGSRRGRGRVVLRSMQRKEKEEVEKEEVVVDPLS